MPTAAELKPNDSDRSSQAGFRRVNTAIDGANINAGAAQSNLHEHSFTSHPLPILGSQIHSGADFSHVAQILTPKSPTIQSIQLKNGQFKVDESFFDDTKASSYFIPPDDMKQNWTVFSKKSTDLEVHNINVDLGARTKQTRPGSDSKQTRTLSRKLETSPAKKQNLLELLECEPGKGKLINKFLVFQDYTSEPNDMKQIEETWVRELKQREESIDRMVILGTSKDSIVLGPSDGE
ncbi:SIZ1 [Candida theae]|uniref:SIZ1 n=1 Tax=Candida theae TaxID=1198502 RepID=A0AAD5FZY4_9ASCO|nr:SIZ1 [Candida theae]KAI5962804.1 SIZ1 [Candida theae]